MLVGLEGLLEELLLKEARGRTAQLCHVGLKALPILHHVNERVDGGMRDVEHEACDGAEQQALPLGQFRPQEAAEDVLVEGDGGVEFRFVLGLHVKHVEGQGMCHICWIKENDIVKTPGDLLDHIPLRVNDTEAALLLRQEVLDELGLAVAGTAQDMHVLQAYG